MLRLQEHGEQFEASSFDWMCVKPFGLVYRCLRHQLEKKLCCGKVLEHAKSMVTHFREEIGIRLCCFKIGVTSNPLLRFASYIERGYAQMWVISVSPSIELNTNAGSSIDF